MKYKGGSLPFDQHNKLKSTITDTGVFLDQGKNHFSVLMKSITEVSYGNAAAAEKPESKGVVFKVGKGDCA